MPGPNLEIPDAMHPSYALLREMINNSDYFRTIHRLFTEHLRTNFGFFTEYLRNIYGLFTDYLQTFNGLFPNYFLNIFGIFSNYFRTIFKLFCPTGGAKPAPNLLIFERVPTYFPAKTQFPPKK